MIMQAEPGTILAKVSHPNTNTEFKKEIFKRMESVIIVIRSHEGWKSKK